MGHILCLDVGSGTQDALCFFDDRTIENCPKFVLPSPAKMVAARVRALTARGAAIHLHGRNMGGGFFGAVREHLRAGLALSAHPQAALALSDDPARLASQGITLAETPPAGHVGVHLADFDPGFWQGLLAQAGLDPPDMVLAAVQDHGHNPGGSNRRTRFDLWRKHLESSDARPERLLYRTAPPEFTRLAALQESTGGNPVMDTGPAAALGALFDPAVEADLARRGGLVINMGNSHILGLLVFEGNLLGVYEHHTGMIAPAALAEQLGRFRTGRISGDEVMESGGHGAMTLKLPAAAKGFSATYVLGPRRADLAGLDAVFPAPGGDMMLAGCFGLLKAWRATA